MTFSRFGERLTNGAGITQLMDDLGNALSGAQNVCMLGGGNPGQIPEIQRHLRTRMQALLDNGDEFERLVGNYDPPQGHLRCIEALAELLRRQFGWPLGPQNIAITNGSQAACFMLFNLLAGEFSNGPNRHILLPLAPEYIGYADQGLTDDFFVANQPSIEHFDQQMFKYHVNFDSLEVSPLAGAICVSRPTNPTGNVLSNEEVAKLSELAKTRKIPLIIDSAYGAPFPGIVFTPILPIWEEHIILCMSLSKLGLPGVRSGIVIASEEIICALSSINGILNLSTGGFGPALVLDLIESGEIITLSQRVIEPFYAHKVDQAVTLLRRELIGYDVHIHQPEGAIFLWLWCRNLPVSSAEFYEHLKRKGVLLISGHHFFPGIDPGWQHQYECLRISYAQDTEMVHNGLRTIAAELRKVYDQGSIVTQP